MHCLLSLCVQPQSLCVVRCAANYCQSLNYIGFGEYAGYNAGAPGQETPISTVCPGVFCVSSKAWIPGLHVLQNLFMLCKVVFSLAHHDSNTSATSLACFQTESAPARPALTASHGNTMTKPAPCTQ